MRRALAKKTNHHLGGAMASVVYIATKSKAPSRMLERMRPSDKLSNHHGVAFCHLGRSKSKAPPGSRWETAGAALQKTPADASSSTSSGADCLIKREG